MIRMVSAADYTWTGAADCAWTNAANWMVDDETPDAAPGAEDRVIFPAEGAPWRVELAALTTVTNLTCEGDTTISGALIQTGEVYGQAPITLGENAGFSTYDPVESELVVSSDLVIAGGATTNVLKSVRATNSIGSMIRLRGALLGTGTVKITGKRLTCELSGDNRAFAGTVYVENDSLPRNATYLASANASSSNAAWCVYNSGNRNFAPRQSTCHYGELTGYYRREIASNWQGLSTVVVGARNTSFTTDGIFGTSSDRADRIEKVGAGTMTFRGKKVYSFNAKAGRIAFPTTNSIPYATYIFSGGAMRFGKDFDADISERIVATAAPVVIDDGGIDREWSGSLDNLTKGIVKLGDGHLTLTSAPACPLEVLAGSLTVPSGDYEIAADTLAVTNGETMTLMSAYAGNNSLYRWNGRASPDWDDPENWTVGGAMAVTPPGAADRVFIPSGDCPRRIRLSQFVTVTNLTVEGDAEFSGAKIRTGEVFGSGRITLDDDAGFAGYDYIGAKMTVSNDLVITASAAHPAGITGRSDSTGNSDSRLGLKLEGRLLGTGEIHLHATRMNAALAGDMSEFAGKLVVDVDQQTRNNTYFSSLNRGSSKASFEIYNSANNTLLGSNGRTEFYFGELTGNPYLHDSNAGRTKNVLEIGALGTDFALGGYYYSTVYPGLISSRGHAIRKVGAGEMVFSGGGVRAYELKEGVFTAGSEAALITRSKGVVYRPYFAFTGGAYRQSAAVKESPLIKNSTADIVIDTPDDLVFTNAIDATNLGGFVKRGAGTLTIDAEFALTGLVYVAEGALVLRAGTYVACAADTFVAKRNQAGTVLKNISERTGDDGFEPVVYYLNQDWSFAKATDYPLSAAIATTNAAEWTSVSLPHSINAHDTFNKLASDAGGAGWRGIAFYRKTITLDPAVFSPGDEKYILEFETVRQAIYLWVNGQKVGYYEAGITSSGFDVSDYLVAGENEITVALDSTSARGMTSYLHETLEGEEWGSGGGVAFQWNTNDFNPTEGGLTGSVRLYVKPKAYLTLPLYNNLKTAGSYVTAADFDFSNRTARVTVAAEARNETAAELTGAAVRVTIRDAGTGAETDSFTSDPVALAQNTNTLITASAAVTNLVFWSPATPHLYDVRIELLENGTAIDAVTIRTGFRQVTFDEEKGLAINGEPIFLTGYAQRSTDEWAAVGIPPEWLQDYDAKLIRESGANFVRWMHVAPKPQMERAFDKYGIVSVAPAGDKEGDVTDRQWEQRVEAMEATIIAYRNSPSVLFYEAGNQAITAEHMAEMTAMKARLDPHGFRRMGCRSLSETNAIADAEWIGTMLNRHAESAAASLATLGLAMPIIECEYAREESPRRSWDDYTPPDYDYVAKDGDTYALTQEDFILSNLKGYSEFYGNRYTGKLAKYYSGAAALCWSDSIQHGRNTASENARMSGRVDPVRIPKPSFYAYRAAQSEDPSVKIVGHWTYPALGVDTYVLPSGLQRDPTKKTVYVVASPHCARVVLKVNGEIVGGSTQPEYVFLHVFPGIDITESGEISAEAYDESGRLLAMDSILTATAPAALEVETTTGPDGFFADGADLAMIDLKLVDASGTLVPTATNRLDFTLTSPSSHPLTSSPSHPLFMGGYNSGVVGDASPIGKTLVNLEAGEARVFVRAGRAAGTVKLTVTCADLGLEKTVTLVQRAFQNVGGMSDTSPQRAAANAVEYVRKTAAEKVQDLDENAAYDDEEEITGARVCYWTGLGGAGNWHDAANWALASGKATAVPRTGDAVVFTNETSVKLSRDVTLAAITNSAPVTLSTEATLKCPSFVGLGDTASLTFAGGVFAHTDGIIIDEPVVFAEKTETTFQSYTSWKAIEFMSSVSGSGTIYADQRGKNSQGYCIFRGDASGFSGEYSLINPGTAKRDFTGFRLASSASSNAIYRVKGADNSEVLGVNGATYRFGAFIGNYFRKNFSNVVFEIGNRDDVESTLGGTGGGTYELVKVGGNILYFNASGYRKVTVKDGIVVFSTTNNLPETISVEKGYLVLPEEVEGNETVLSRITVGEDGEVCYTIPELPEREEEEGEEDEEEEEEEESPEHPELYENGGTLILENDLMLVTNLTVGASWVTIDLNGHALVNSNDFARWMIDVGTNSVTIKNGTIAAGRGYGIFVTDGSVALSNVQVTAAGRALQLAGHGKIDEDAASALLTTGNDPALMIVGGFDGKAEAHLRGTVSNLCAGIAADRSDFRYAVSGRSDDLAGAEIVIYDSAAVGTLKDGGAADAEAVYFPESEARVAKARAANPAGAEPLGYLEIPEAWLTARGYGRFEVGANGPNGLKLWESYALGLEPTEEPDELKVNAVVENGRFKVSVTDAEYRPVTGVTTEMRLIELDEHLREPPDGSGERAFDGETELEMDSSDNLPHCYRVRLRLKF